MLLHVWFLCTHHVLVIEQVHHAWRPFAHQHQVRRSFIEPKQTKSSWLFYTVHRITANWYYQQLSEVSNITLFLMSSLQGKCKKQKQRQISVSLPNFPSIRSQTHPATRIRGISLAKASAISRLPTFAIQWSARHMKVGLRLERSFLMALLIRRINSLLLFTSTEMNR